MKEPTGQTIAGRAGKEDIKAKSARESRIACSPKTKQEKTISWEVSSVTPLDGHWRL